MESERKCLVELVAIDSNVLLGHALSKKEALSGKLASLKDRFLETERMLGVEQS